jgi:hypothetical protein
MRQAVNIPHGCARLDHQQAHHAMDQSLTGRYYWLRVTWCRACTNKRAGKLDLHC